MKTELRLFLAILISILILVVYQTKFAPKTKIQQVKPQESSIPVATKSAEKIEKGDAEFKAQDKESFSYQQWLKENTGIILDTNMYTMQINSAVAGITSLRIPDYKEHFYVRKQFENNLLKLSFKEYEKLKGTGTGVDSIARFQDMVENISDEELFSLFQAAHGKEKPLYADIYRLKEIDKRVQTPEDNQGVELVSVNSTFGYKPLELLNEKKKQNIYQNESWTIKEKEYSENGTSGIILEMTNEISIDENIIEVAQKIRTYDKQYYFDVETEFTNHGETEIELGEQFINIGPGIGFIAESGYRSKTNESFVYLAEKKVQRFNEQREVNASPDWVALESQYFACIVIPQFKTKKILFITRDEEKYKQILVGLNTFVMNAREQKIFKARLFIGPKKLDELKKLDNQVARIIDFGMFAMISKPLFDLLNVFYKITRNYGLAILVLTVLIKLIFYPLNKNQIKSMERMKKIQPVLDEIKAKYKNDPKKMNTEYWAAMKKNKANPLGGCLPLVIQIPVFFALYNILINAIEMRHATFLYIHDLSSADPYYISPILMGITMVLQQKMTPSTVDPAQQKMMMMMPIVFTVIFLNMPSGLVIYWLASNVLGIAQQVLMTRKKGDSTKKVKKAGGKKWNR
ncbi:MAG: hypothetical protein A2161_07030 [Candidatus Schekmanbacteria bacterium RBG_13_48_7]|uniref:Membrane protein insertase YidC n=1 Tax=Candidatus Schekmanbacteria bacterium RBG_13_48_7 TaxID=1817878 RepID=A0A1F7RQZ9_9BACT|nr:MAG: hypothetical protein A2161_07030 [Candidatus Schekmanbacteria bacterium RBG_13_48_7]